MTNQLALWLAGFLAILIGADFVLTGGATLLFLAKEFMNLMDWVEFWR